MNNLSGHVLGNANFDAGRQICEFTRSLFFFSKVENDHVFFQIKDKNADQELKRNGLNMI